MANIGFVVMVENDLEVLFDQLFEAKDVIEAVRRCIDPSAKGSFLTVRRKVDNKQIAEFYPYAHWQTMDAFLEQVSLRQQVQLIQNNLEITPAEAALSLVLRAIEQDTNRR